MRACVYGNATILPAGPTEPFARLQLSSLCRGRLEDVRPGQHEPVWFADVSPWPLDGDLPEAPTAKDLKHRFLRLLLATRDPQADPSSLRQQLGRPLGELANTSERVTMLWLLADYLFDQPHPRVALIQAPDASFVVHTIADALELAEAGVPVGPRALAGPLAQTVVSASEDAITMLDDLALIIEAFAPLVVTEDASSRISKQAHEISESARQLSRRVEKTVTSLVKAGKSRNR